MTSRIGHFDCRAAFVPVLVDEVNPLYMGAAGKAMVGAGRPIELVVEAFRTGGGVPVRALW